MRKFKQLIVSRHVLLFGINLYDEVDNFRTTTLKLFCHVNVKCLYMHYLIKIISTCRK